MKRNKLVIVGLGAIGWALLKSLSREYEITCIDVDKNSVEVAGSLFGDRARVIVGDATSRLVLEKAVEGGADTVIITTTKEVVNIEVARVLHDHFSVKRVISVGIDKENIGRLKELGVETENIFSASATGLRNKIESRSREAHGIGLGKKEILECEVHPNSRLVNKKVSLIAPYSCRIGIVYRDGNIVIPDGDTILKARDKVVMLGEPQSVKIVSDLLTFSSRHFPLEYGSTLLAYLSGKEKEGFFDELSYLMSIFPLAKTVIVYSNKPQEVPGREDYFDAFMRKTGFTGIEAKQASPDVLANIISGMKDKPGIVAISKRSFIDPVSPFYLDSSRNRFLHVLSTLTACPLLLSMETFPYNKLVTPAIGGINLRSAIETAFAISSSIDTEISAVTVEPSRYISSGEEFVDFGSMKTTISGMSHIYKACINSIVVKGNPVKAILGELANHNLLLIDTGGWKQQGLIASILEPNVLSRVILKSPVSVLVTPPVEETL
ncbi:MAG: TrkA family potassium uptake protein [Nitrospirae bacterium]|nr:TrkA family potassium uptake protein [Nitrospirota bacterium]